MSWLVLEKQMCTLHKYDTVYKRICKQQMIDSKTETSNLSELEGMFQSSGTQPNGACIRR